MVQVGQVSAAVPGVQAMAAGTRRPRTPTGTAGVPARTRRTPTGTAGVPARTRRPRWLSQTSTRTTRRVLPDTPSPRLGQTARRRIIHWTLMRAGRPRSQSGQTCASRHPFTPPRSDRPTAYHPSDLAAGGTPALPVGPDVCFQTPLHPASVRPPDGVSSIGP